MMLKQALLFLHALLAVVLLSQPVALAAAPGVTQPQVDTPKRLLFVGNSYYYGEISKAEAAFLQQVAEETVKKFSGR